MAIFNTTPEVEVQESCDVLDSMLEACNSMLDAIDIMDEAAAGGARGKYVKLMADKAEKEENKSDYYNDVAKATSSDKGANEYRKKAEDASHKASEYSNKAMDASVSYYGNRLDGDNYKTAAKHSNIGARHIYGQANDRKAKKEWMEAHGNKGEDKLGNRKPGTYSELQAKKKAIKETCMYILDILDEI